MGSPICVTRTSRIHTVRTVRGAAMILNKVLRSAYETHHRMEVFDYEQLVERTVQATSGPRSVSGYAIVSPTWVNNDWYTCYGQPFEATQHGYTIITEFLQAIVESRYHNRTVAIHFGANYAWVGSDGYECVVLVNL